jgi:hypothetical protein
MCAKMPIVIESVGDRGQRVEQGFEWPDDSALKRVEKEGGRISGRHPDMAAFARSPVLPEVTLVSALSAQSRRPRPWSATSAICRFRSLMGQGRKLFGCRRFRVPAFSACSFGTRWGKLGAGRLG